MPKKIEEQKELNDNDSLKKEIISWVKTIVASVIIALCINKLIIVNAIVPSGSMERTIMTGDRIIAFRLSYLFNEPQRGDIVVFKFPDDEKLLYVKRIIGIPGDKVEIKEGNVFINGELQKETYIREEMFTVMSWGPYEVPEGAYFMMGDNRNYSEDARYWDNTYVYRDKILGKVFLKYYPKIESMVRK